MLLEGHASAEFLRQTLVPLMLARRPPDTDRASDGAAEGRPRSRRFLTRIGLRVMADSFSVSDTPSLRQFDGQPVAGAYIVDDEAVRAKDVTLVDKGRLLTLLTSRTPQKTSCSRTGTVGAAAHRQASSRCKARRRCPRQSSRPSTSTLLKAQDKPFGYIVRAIASPGEYRAGGPVAPSCSKR